MFQCEITGRMSEPGEKCHKIVVETRPRTYTKWVKNEETLRWEEVEAGRGWEIVREISATSSGVDAWNSLDEEARKALLKMSVNDRVHLGL